MDKLYIEDLAAKEDENDSDYVKSASGGSDSDFDDIEMDSFIAEENEENEENGHLGPLPKMTNRLTREDIDSLAQLEGKRVVASDDYISANKNRTFSKLKKLSDDTSEQNSNIPYQQEDDFIVDDLGFEEDKDDYTLEIKVPTHSSESMNLVASIFGDISDFLRGEPDLQTTGDIQEPVHDFQPEEASLKKSVGSQKEQKLPLSDCPRRFSHHSLLEGLVPSDAPSLELFLIEEAAFIRGKAFPAATGSLFDEKIRFVLSVFHKEKLEVPQLVTYRQKSWRSLNFDEEDLWRIYHADVDYCHWFAQKRKTARAIEARLLELETRATARELSFLRSFATKATEQVELDDLATFLNFLSSCEFATKDGSARSIVRHLYSAAFPGPDNQPTLLQRVAGGTEMDDFGESVINPPGDKKEKKNGRKHRKTRIVFDEDRLSLVRAVGLSGRMACLFDRDGHQGKGQQRDEKQPDENALAQLGEDEFQRSLRKFENAEKAVAFVIAFAAKELALNPVVKKFCRAVFLEAAAVSTCPTKKGKRDIDWTSPFFTVKRLCKKPVRVFLDDFEKRPSDVMLEQYAIIDDAYQKKFITRSFGLFEGSLEYGKLEERLKSVLKIQTITETAGASKLSTLASVRERIVMTALKQHIFTHCSSYTNSLLLRKAQQYIASECAVELRSKWLLTRGIEVAGACAFSVSLGDLHEPSFCAIVNDRGSLVDFAKFNFLKIFVGRNASMEHRVELSKKNEDLESFKNLILEHCPALIVIGASAFGCDTLLSDLQKVCNVSNVKIRCELVRPDVAKIFERSKRAENEFSDFPAGLRNAVSLARLALDPQAELCYLASAKTGSRDILSLRLHEQQKQVPECMLLRELTRVLVEVVNRVGLDTSNGALSLPHKSPALEFVCGLDEEMANFLIGHRVVTSRDHLSVLMENFPKIFKNCAGFLRIESSQEVPRPLYTDKTRIHPELLPLAQSVLLIALGKKERNVPNTEAKALSKTVNKLAKKVKKNLRTMISFDFAKCLLSLRQNECFSSSENLEPLIKLIVNEIRRPFYCEEITDFKKLDEEELFWIMTGESKRSLRRDQLVTATVVGFNKGGALCQLNCNVLGKIPPGNLVSSDKAHQFDEKMTSLKKIIKVGTTLKARISEIVTQKGRYSIVLDARPAVVENKGLEDPSSIYLPKKLDRYLDAKPEKEEKVDNETTPKTQSFIPRKIDFPLFKNFSREESENHLQSKDVGSVIIRPSSRGVNFLMATWKISTDPFIVVNVEIREKNKPNSFSIGRVLEINNHAYEDLDEIYTRYFNRMTSRIKEMMSFRRFRFGTEKEVENLVLFDKREHPNTIPYSFGFSLKHPGCLILFYMFHKTVKKEFVVLLPQGFKYRGKVFKSPEELVQWFKRNPYTNSPFIKAADDRNRVWKERHLKAPLSRKVSSHVFH